MLRHDSDTPPLRMMTRSWSLATSGALWGGTAFSGSGFHYHNPAYNLLFFGTKQWMITPPRYAGLSDLDSIDWPDQGSKEHLPDGLPIRFTQRAGDLVIVPAQWGHSTLSDGGFTLGLGVLWCDQRWMNLSAGECHLSPNPCKGSGLRRLGSIVAASCTAEDSRVAWTTCGVSRSKVQYSTIARRRAQRV